MPYPAKITTQGMDNFVVRFPDIPEAHTVGDTKQEALRHAADALETAIDAYLERGIAVPPPSALKRGQVLVNLPISVTMKVMLHNELLRQHVRPAELARRLNMPRQNMKRLLDFRKTTSVDSLGQALEALGRHVEVTLS